MCRYPRRPKEGVGFPGAKNTCGCELINTVARNRTGVLCKSTRSVGALNPETPLQTSTFPFLNFDLPRESCS